MLTKNEICSLLRSELKTSNIVLKQYRVEPLSKNPTGYMASHTIITATIEHDGDIKDLSFFIKSSPMQSSQVDILVRLNAFPKEVGFYTLILPAMQKVIECANSDISLPIPKFYLLNTDAARSDVVVLENLQASGFKLPEMCRNSNAFDFQHCSITLEALARFHATSFAAEVKDGVSFDKSCNFLNAVHFTGNKDIYTDQYIMQCLRTAQKIAVNLLPHHAKHADKLNTRMSNIYEELSDIAQAAVDSFKVVCHSDLWLSNLMYKYEKNQTYNIETPIEVKLVDFQLLNYRAPVFDLILFIYGNTTRSTREQHLGRFLEIYHSTFLDTIAKLNVTAPKSFTLEDLSKSFHNKKLLGVTYGLEFRVLALIDMDKFGKYLDISSMDGLRKFMLEGGCGEIIHDQFLHDEQFRAIYTELVDELIEALDI